MIDFYPYAPIPSASGLGVGFGYLNTEPNRIFGALGLQEDMFPKRVSKVVSTHLWNTPLNLYQQAIMGFLS